ncbi:MAG TPA: hypothetical protein VGG61_06690 [Gemmataceae bacterium]
MSAGAERPFDFSRLQRSAWLVGAALLAISAVYGVFRPAPFFRAYLIGFRFWLSFPLGCIALVMVQHLTGGLWGAVLRPILEAASRTLPLMALLFLPLLLGLTILYPWTDKDHYADDPPMLEKIEFYLNVPFFLARAAIYFAAWLVFAFFLNRWSREQTQHPTPTQARRFRLISGPGLAVYGLTLTLASVDWFMSLEPEWFSSIYGVIVAVGQLLAAFAFAVLMIALLARRPPLAGVVSPSVLNDLGGLLLAFTMLWAYVAFSQYLLIWAGNLPEETSWYLRRIDGVWGWVAISLAVFQFFVPFALLLSKDVKQNPRALAATAILILVMRFVDAVWSTGPAFADSRWWDQWLVLAVPLGMGGLMVGTFLWQLGQRPLVFEYELKYAEGLADE